MKKLVALLVFAVLRTAAPGQTSAQRPHILGIDHVSFYTTAPEGVKKLYGGILGLASAAPVEPGGTARYVVAGSGSATAQHRTPRPATAWITSP